jgi:UDP-N-acetylmuramoyl-tripeptide--D-alanyl-D-alanine ligase
VRKIEFEKVVDVIDGEYIGNKGLKNRTLSGISVDSRTIKENELFFALEGKNFNGFDFAEEAIKKSGLPAVVTKEIKNKEIILVKDPLASLGDLASYYKKETNVFAIAVTGSYGKTTTKDFLGSIFSEAYSTLVSYKNYNNLIGVPLNLFRLEKEEMAILEFGTSKIGEIKRLSEIVQPDIAVITGIGLAHLEAFKDKEGVLREKKDITAGLKGTLFVNGDDLLLRKIDGSKVIKVGFSQGNDIVFKILQESVDGTIFSAKGMNFWIGVPSIGMLKCAMLAVSVALYYEISKKDIQEGLKNVEKASHRMEIKKIGNFNVADDTYNSNPDSLLNAVSFLSFMPGRKIAVLGPMLELGANSFSIHKDIGEKIRYRIHELVVIGEEAKGFIEGFCGGRFASNKEEAFKILREIIDEGDTILFKSSRALKLETLVELLKEDNCFTYSPL